MSQKPSSPSALQEIAYLNFLEVVVGLHCYVTGDMQKFLFSRGNAATDLTHLFGESLLFPNGRIAARYDSSPTAPQAQIICHTCNDASAIGELLSNLNYGDVSESRRGSKIISPLAGSRQSSKKLVEHTFDFPLITPHDVKVPRTVLGSYEQFKQYVNSKHPDFPQYLQALLE